MLIVNRALWNASTIDEILNDGFSEEKEADSDVDDDIQILSIRCYIEN